MSEPRPDMKARKRKKAKQQLHAGDGSALQRHQEEEQQQRPQQQQAAPQQPKKRKPAGPAVPVEQHHVHDGAGNHEHDEEAGPSSAEAAAQPAGHKKKVGGVMAQYHTSMLSSSVPEYAAALWLYQAVLPCTHMPHTNSMLTVAVVSFLSAEAQAGQRLSTSNNRCNSTSRCTAKRVK